MAQTLDPEEVDHFSKIAAQWWDPEGKFRPLHKMNPLRLGYVKAQLCRHFERDAKAKTPLAGLQIVDIGCGGGLLSEPLTRLGAQVTGIDPAERNIQVAQQHAKQQGLKIDYRHLTAEDLQATGAQFDAVICLEVVEHVPDVPAFVRIVGRLVRPGGIAVFSTLNRTVKSFALAIVGAEYILRWLPRGTHQWHRFVTPDELQKAVELAGLRVSDRRGAVYHPLFDTWRLSESDLDVNYFLTAHRAMSA